MSAQTRASFRNDLKESLAAWQVFPWLPIISVVLAGAAFLQGAFALIGFAAYIFTAGWVGTQRICYLRAFRRKTITRDQALGLTRAFIGRYAVLGLLFGLITSIALFPIILAAARDPVALENGEIPDASGWYWAVLFATFVLVDLALTFVTPALAFTTRSVRRALSIGLGMIRQEWPSCALYVLVPPLALLLFVQTPNRLADVGIEVRMVIAAVATLLNLWFKGATAAFYLRSHAVGDDGAAFADQGAAPDTTIPNRPDLD